MAAYDPADLLSRCKNLAARPDNDTSMTDARWFQFLTESEAHWKPVFASHFPWYYWGPLTLMVTSDSGATYTLSDGSTPLRIEIYDSPTGNLLRPSSYWDGSGGYVWEGNRIRFPEANTVSFQNGAPYSRTISPPGTIDASTASTLVPDFARVLLVYRAVAEWAARGGLRDPTPFQQLEQRAWFDPGSGTGILVQLKSQNPFEGAAAYSTQEIMPITNIIGIS